MKVMMQIMVKGRCRREASGRAKQRVLSGICIFGSGLERGEAWSQPQAVVRTEEFLAIKLKGGSSREGCKVRDEGLGPNPIHDQGITLRRLSS